jgi:hypothetical protein
VNADLHFRDEAIDLRIGCGKCIGFNGPARNVVLFGEFDCRQRRCKRVVTFGESHCLAKVGAAKNGEPVHAVGGDVDRCADAIRQMRVTGEPNGVPASRHQFRERDPRLRRVNLLRRQVDVLQYFVGWATLVDEYVEQRRELGRFVNPLMRSNDRSFLCVVRNEAQGGRPAGLLGVAQLNLPLGHPRFKASVALSSAQDNSFCDRLQAWPVAAPHAPGAGMQQLRPRPRF